MRSSQDQAHREKQTRGARESRRSLAIIEISRLFPLVGAGAGSGGGRLTAGGIEDHLQHGTRTERGADDVRDGLRDVTRGRAARSTSGHREETDPSPRSCRHWLAHSCASLNHRRRSNTRSGRVGKGGGGWRKRATDIGGTRTLAAAMLFSCAVRPVSRLVLVSAQRSGVEPSVDANQGAATHERKESTHPLPVFRFFNAARRGGKAAIAGGGNAEERRRRGCTHS